jgi:hypothetical protein
MLKTMNYYLMEITNQVISPFTKNNKLIDDVVSEDEIKTYASTPSPTNPNSYLSTIEGTNITGSHNVENNELLLNGDNQVISPFTKNNKLIDDVVSEDEIKTYASTPDDTPKISYAANILNSSSIDNSATLKYNNQTQNINGSSLPIESYDSAEGFSVYQDKDITKNSTDLLTANNSLTFTQTQIIEAPENSGKLTGNPSIQDFRKTLLDGKTESRIMSLAPNYNGKC